MDTVKDDPGVNMKYKYAEEHDPVAKHKNSIVKDCIIYI